MPTLESHPYLLQTDVDAIQAYIFSSVKLATIAGASMIVAEYDKQLRQLAVKHDGWVLSANGGSATVLFPADKAELFAIEAEELFRASSGSGHLTVSDVVDVRDHQRDGDRGFGAALEAAARSLELRKRMGHGGGERFAFPLARRCEVGSREPATAREPLADGEKWIGQSALKKWNARKEAKKLPSHHWVTLLDGFDAVTDDEIRKRLPQDFNDLAGETDYLALVVADVNGVGDRIAELASPEHYQRFAGGLSDALLHTLAEALNVTAKPSEVWNADNDRTLPVIVLFHGGDDLVLACKGDLALPLMDVLTRTFRGLNKQPERISTDDGQSWNDDDPLGMSAVAVITGRKFPFRTSHRIAHRLLGEAKRTARAESGDDRESNWHSGAVDFVLVTEAHCDAESVVKARRFKAQGRSLYLTGKPFCVSSTGPRSLAGFKAACQQLGKFPGSRLYELREICSPRSFRDLEENDMSGALGLVKEKLNDWQASTMRTPTSRTVWEDACIELGIHSKESKDAQVPPELLQGEGSDWRTVVGDLADALGMWADPSNARERSC